MNLVTIETKDFGTFHVDNDNMHLFWYFVFERQNVYYRRFVEKLPKPWTEDRILNEFKFTNVHRELDRTTVWYHENIAGYPISGKCRFPKGFGMKDVIFATFVHRLFNNIHIMAIILPYLRLKTYDRDKIFNLIDKERQSGVSVFTSAHMTTGVRYAGSPDKLVNIIHLIDLIHQSIDDICHLIMSVSNLEELYKASTRIQGFGPFLGYQFILDIINSGIHKFSHEDFVVAGPGCKRGIRHIFPNANEISNDNAMRFLRSRQHKYFEKYNYNYQFLDSLGGKEVGIHLGNIENCLCEFQKYHRAYTGVGQPRNRYIYGEQNAVHN